jgi:hypothetical protein
MCAGKKWFEETCCVQGKQSGLWGRLVRAVRWKRIWATQGVGMQNKGKAEGSRWAVAGPRVRRKIKERKKRKELGRQETYGPKDFWSWKILFYFKAFYKL